MLEMFAGAVLMLVGIVIGWGMGQASKKAEEN